MVWESLDVSQKNFNQGLFKVNYDTTVIILPDIHLKRRTLGLGNWPYNFRVITKWYALNSVPKKFVLMQTILCTPILRYHILFSNGRIIMIVVATLLHIHSLTSSYLKVLYCIFVIWQMMLENGKNKLHFLLEVLLCIRVFCIWCIFCSTKSGAHTKPFAFISSIFVYGRLITFLRFSCHLKQLYRPKDRINYLTSNKLFTRTEPIKES